MTKSAKVTQSLICSIEPRWERCIVAAPGPSLPYLEHCGPVVDGKIPVIVVQDAWRRIPWADVLYGCDARWWNYHKGAPEFRGERYSTTDRGTNRKENEAEAYGIQLLWGVHGTGFSRKPDTLHYGSNSGFQAINLAILFGCTDIALVGFDWHRPGGKTHFFGEHPPGFGNANFSTWTREMQIAADRLEGVNIVNCTPDSALRVFPMGTLDAFTGD